MGRELSVPFAVAITGEIAFTDDPVQQLTDHVTTLIGTEKGERLMRPDYGAGTQSFLFEDNDGVTQAVLESSIRDVVSEYEPNVAVSRIDFDQQPAEGYLGIRVGFSIVNDGSQAERVASIGISGEGVTSRG